MRISIYEAHLAELLTVGAKSTRFQLNVWSEETENLFPNGKPLRDAGRTLDGALRSAKSATTRAKGVVLVVAWRWHVSELTGKGAYVLIGPVFELRKSKG